MSASEKAPPPPASRADDRSWAARVTAGGVATAVGAVLLVLFMLQNRDDVTLTLLVWDFTWPLWLLVVVSAGLGCLVWIGQGVLRRRRARPGRGRR